MSQITGNYINFKVVRESNTIALLHMHHIRLSQLSLKLDDSIQGEVYAMIRLCGV